MRSVSLFEAPRNRDVQRSFHPTRHANLQKALKALGPQAMRKENERTQLLWRTLIQAPRSLFAIQMSFR